MLAACSSGASVPTEEDGQGGLGSLLEGSLIYLEDCLRMGQPPLAQRIYFLLYLFSKEACGGAPVG